MGLPSAVAVVRIRIKFPGAHHGRSSHVWTRGRGGNSRSRPSFASLRRASTPNGDQRVVLRAADWRSFLGLFGAIALALAVIGFYGVLAYSVSHRSREVGIRMAVGASRPNVLGVILSQGACLTALGLAAGVVIAVAVTRFMRELLLDVSPTDVPTV